MTPKCLETLQDIMSPDGMLRPPQSGLGHKYCEIADPSFPAKLDWEEGDSGRKQERGLCEEGNTVNLLILDCMR